MNLSKEKQSPALQKSRIGAVAPNDLEPRQARWTGRLKNLGKLKVIGWSVLLGLVFCFPQESLAQRGQGPFDALDGLVARVRSGLERWLAGEPLEKAILPLLPRFHPRRILRTRDALQKADVRSFVFFAMEFEALLSGPKGKPMYLRTLIHPHRGGWKLFEAEMRESSSAITGRDLFDLKGSALPFGKAGKAFHAWLQSPQCPYLPFATMSDLPSGFPQREKRRGESKLQSLPQRWTRICREIQEKKLIKFRLRVDDIAMFGFDSSGKLQGMLRLEWRIEDKGELYLKIGSFRQLRKSRPVSQPTSPSELPPPSPPSP